MLELALSIAVLLFSLGPKELGREVEGYLESKAQGKTEQTREAAYSLCNPEAPDEEPLQSLIVARHVMIEANRRLFGPLLWFLLLGPAGAFLYRVNQLAGERIEFQEESPDQLQLMANKIQELLDWIPARLTAIGYAISGNFEKVAGVWKNFHRISQEQNENEAALLLSSAGTAALESYPSVDEIEYLVEVPPVVEDALALVWRTLFIWVIAVGLGSLVAALT